MRFPFSVSSITFVILCLFDNSHTDGCGVISHCGFCLPFLIVMLNIFSSACWPSVCLLWKNICSFFPTIFDWVICFDLELHELFVILKINPLFIALFVNIFPHCVGCLFALLMFYFIF